MNIENNINMCIVKSGWYVIKSTEVCFPTVDITHFIWTPPKTLANSTANHTNFGVWSPVCNPSPTPTYPTAVPHIPFSLAIKYLRLRAILFCYWYDSLSALHAYFSSACYYSQRPSPVVRSICILQFSFHTKNVHLLNLKVVDSLYRLQH